MLRKHLSLFLILLTGIVDMSAQDLRTIRGLVADENGQAIGAATLKVEGLETPFKTNRIGQFTIRIPFGSRSVTAYVDGYTSVTLDATAGFLLFKMKPQAPDDAATQARAEREAAALAAAASGSVAAVPAGTAAAQQAPLAQPEQARQSTQAQPQAQPQQEAQQRPRQSAQAQPQQAQQPQQQTPQQPQQQAPQQPQQQQAKQQPQQQAQPQAEQQPKPQQPQAKQQTKQARQSGPRSKESGLAHSFDFSYAYQLYGGQIVYTDSGVRKYSNLHPLQATYSIGWRFNRMFTLMAGAGFLYNLTSLEREGDTVEAGLYGGKTPLRFDVPVFINFRCHFTRAKIRPYISLSGGVYALSLAPLADLGAGVSFHLGGTAALNLALSARNTPWPQYSSAAFHGYPVRIVPAVTAGITF